MGSGAVTPAAALATPLTLPPPRPIIKDDDNDDDRFEDDGKVEVGGCTVCCTSGCEVGCADCATAEDGCSDGAPPWRLVRSRSAAAVAVAK
jgi:hypothetical protein